MKQQLDLIRLGKEIDRLFHAVYRAGHGTDLDIDGIGQQLRGNLLHLRRHGGGKEQSLTRVRQFRHNLSHIVNKAHIQHTVRFIQHKDADIPQGDVSLPDQVIETAGGGNQNINARAQLLHLRVLVDSAENNGTAHRQIFAVLREIIINLKCQLTGRREDQGADGTRGILIKVLGTRDALKNGKCEGRRFSRTRLGTAEHVLALQYGGHRFLLNGGGFCISDLADRP